MHSEVGNLIESRMSVHAMNHSLGSWLIILRILDSSSPGMALPLFQSTV